MKIGIVADNYKVELFRKKLNGEKFVFTEFPFTKDCTQIHVLAEKEQVPAINRICNEVELHFKRSN